MKFGRTINMEILMAFSIYTLIVGFFGGAFILAATVLKEVHSLEGKL